jgi:divalent metal cation (Fe/Co/Zn/Cd) transporter
VAIVLMHESRGLLVGEGVRVETARAIRDIALQEPAVRATGPVLSMYIGAEEVLLTLDLMFEDGVRSSVMDETMASIERRIRERYPKIRRIYLEPHLSA